MDEYSDNEYEENSHHLEEDPEDNPIFPSPSPNKNVSSSVQEFLKQSNEIQEEIRKLSSLCDEASHSVSKPQAPRNLKAEKWEARQGLPPQQRRSRNHLRSTWHGNEQHTKAPWGTQQGSTPL